MLLTVLQRDALTAAIRSLSTGPSAQVSDSIHTFIHKLWVTPEDVND
jgi:hypothetical protein